MASVTEARRRGRRPNIEVEGFAGASEERSALDQYLREVSRHELLTPQQEIELGHRAQAGDEEAVQALVRANLRFVISVAKKYQNRGVSLIDLIQEGNVGLVTAARKFDPDQGVKFISYAVWWIRQAILSALANQGRAVRVPLNRASDLARIFREGGRAVGGRARGAGPPGRGAARGGGGGGGAGGGPPRGRAPGAGAPPGADPGGARCRDEGRGPGGRPPPPAQGGGDPAGPAARRPG